MPGRENTRQGPGQGAGLEWNWRQPVCPGRGQGGEWQEVRWELGKGLQAIVKEYGAESQGDGNPLEGRTGFLNVYGLFSPISCYKADC